MDEPAGAELLDTSEAASTLAAMALADSISLSFHTAVWVLVILAIVVLVVWIWNHPPRRWRS